MATTPVYFWPYQALTDPPNGATLGANLALAVEATVQANAATAAAALNARLAPIEGAWTPYVPSLANLTVGGGTLVGRYRLVGKTVDVLFSFTYGAGSAVGTSPTFALPFAPFYSAGRQFPLTVTLLDASTALFVGIVDHNAGGTTLEVKSLPYAVITATSPFTWDVGDVILVWGTYEAA